MNVKRFSIKKEARKWPERIGVGVTMAMAATNLGQATNITITGITSD